MLKYLHTLLFSSLICFSLRAYEGSVSYEKYFRLNNPIYRSDSGDLIDLGLQSAPLTKEKGFDHFLKGDFRFYFQDNNALNYSLQEAYLHYQGEQFQLSVGRKILDWNPNEKYWSLGYLNANQAFTLLSTEEEGITGIIFNKNIGPFEFDVLLSYLFIPQVNPSVEFKNGEVQSKSDWVRLPPKKTIVTSNFVPIYYNDPEYNLSKIIFNKSLGGNVRYHWNKGGIAAFAVYKPENVLRANASAYYDNSLGQVVVSPVPTVNHHAYYGVQLFQAFGDLKTRGGLSYVDPNARLGRDFPISNARKTYNSDYFTINPRYDKEAYAHFSLNLDRKDYLLSLNFINLLTKNIRASDDFFSDTVKWNRAFGGSVTYFLNDSFSLMVDMKYDVLRYDNIIKGEFKYNFQDKVNISLGLEVLKAPQDASYWSYYRTSDSLYSSIGFIF